MVEWQTRTLQVRMRAISWRFKSSRAHEIYMKNYREYFKGKKITCLGLGLLGKGFINPLFLAKCGAQIIATDLKTKEQLAPTIAKLKKFKNITFSLGGHKLEDFKNIDFVLKNQGVPLDSIYVAEARKNGIPIEMDEALFMKLSPGVTIVGVTGTRGKSTTTTLIYEILKAAFGKRVHIAGNLPGTAALPLLAKTKSGDIVVFELSSWQLQGFGDSKISPHISVFTSFQDDHLNYYKGDREAYFSDKANIYKYQKPENFIICNKEISDKIGKTIGTKIVTGRKDVSKNLKLKIRGEHNLDNISYAIKVAEILKVPKDIIKKSLENFKGVEGRQEFLRKYKGIEIYNNTNATTPDATLAAIKTFGAKKNLVLIMGGADKTLDMSGLIKGIPNYCRAVILLSGTGTEKLKENFKEEVKDWLEFDNLKDAVKKALSLCRKGDNLILSPAFASFGMFKNEYDRGEKFVKIVKKLK